MAPKEVCDKFTYRVNAGYLGTRTHNRVEDLPLTTQRKVLEYLPKTLAAAEKYVTGKARLPPLQLDFQGMVEFELNVPLERPS